MGNIRHSAHWGAFTAQVDDGRVVGVKPFKEDPNPTPILKGMAEALYHGCRVAEPMIRKGWLENGPGGIVRLFGEIICMKRRQQGDATSWPGTLNKTENSTCTSGEMK